LDLGIPLTADKPLIIRFQSPIWWGCELDHYKGLIQNIWADVSIPDLVGL